MSTQHAPSPASARHAQARRRTWLSGGTLVLAVVGYFVFLDRTSGPALPRDDITAGLELAANTQAAVAAYIRTQRDYPVDNAAAGLPGPERIRNNVVESVTVDAGQIIIEFGTNAHPRLAGRILTLIPDVVEDGEIRWACDLPDLDASELPAECRLADYRDVASEAP
jgi:type IV pilus assembly protein PilA